MSKLGRYNEARRKVESQALFYNILKNPHLVAQVDKYKGSRQSNNYKAIKESRSDD
jgi:hypothetical protein